MVLGHMRSQRVHVRFERVQFWLKLSDSLITMSREANNSKVKALQHENVLMMKELQTVRDEFSQP